MSARSPHRLILASAGTGKTYQLTGRFLELLVDDVPPEEILATTFTRKAAGEILDRVLRRLVEAATDAEKRAELNAWLGRDLGAARYRAILADLARGIDRFRIRTLDAFFVTLGRLFALDLGLPADWTIVEEVEDTGLRREALASALERAQRGEVVELLRRLQRVDGAERSVERVLLDHVRHGRDAYLDSHEPAWSVVQAPPGPGEEELARARAALEAFDLPKTKKGTPNATWGKAHEKALRCLQADDWDGLPEVGYLKKVAAGETSYSGHPIEGELQAACTTLLREAAHRAVAGVVGQNAALREWLEHFEVAYEDEKRERRAYRFEDLPKALAPPGDDFLAERRLEMWFRLDGHVNHLLLDEFQDTAPVQWRILENLASEILADGTGARSFFCVGDVKQSIYGWREAEPRLLAGLATRYPQLDPPEQLTKSFRSSRVVLDTVNRVFGNVGETAALERHDSYRAAAREWQRDFGPHEAAKDLPGAVWLVEAPEAGEDEDAELLALRLTAARARAVVAEAPAATVGLLLRRNHHIARLIWLLRQEGLRASGEGGNPLTDSRAVLHALSLFHLADHPSDSAAAFHVATSPLGPALGLPRERDDRAPHRVASDVRRRLAAEGYGAFCGSLRAVVAEHYGEWDRKRFDQLVDLAWAFDRRAGTRSDLFVDHVRATQVEDPSSTQVKVMTIHAAKGLEFDAVILPELDEQRFIGEVHLLTRRDDPGALLDAVSVAAKRETCDLDPEGLGALRYAQEKRHIREVLCVLYVAMTRAKHRLDLVVQHRKKADIPHSYAGILREALGNGPAGADGVVWAHPDNASPWFPRATAERAEAPTPPAPPLPRFRRSTAPRTRPRRSPSAEEGGGTRRPNELLRAPRSHARTRGLLIHRWMQEIEWLEDFDATDDELRALAAPFERDRALRAELLAEFRRYLAQPNTAALLSRGRYDAKRELEVWRERPFSLVLPDEEGDGESHWTGAFDRVVLEREGGALVAAEVIDFKTDEVDEESIAERTAYYRPQMDAYRRVLAVMSGLGSARIGARLVFLGVDSVESAPRSG